MDRGYIKVYRSLIDKGYFKNSKFVHLWVYLLIKASYRPKEYVMDGKIHNLEPGQFITGRKTMSLETRISPTSIERILRCFENEQQIGQQTFNKFRIITILNWDKYQISGQQNGQLTDNKRTTNGQQTDTINKDNKDNKEKKERRVFVKPSFEDVKNYCIERKNNIDPEAWIHYYESNGWMVGKNKMQNWKSTIITWEKRNAGTNTNIGSDARPWIRRPGQELSGEAQRALDDVKRIERERAAAKLAASNQPGQNA